MIIVKTIGSDYDSPKHISFYEYKLTIIIVQYTVDPLGIFYRKCYVLVSLSTSTTYRPPHTCYVLVSPSTSTTFDYSKYCPRATHRNGLVHFVNKSA